MLADEGEHRAQVGSLDAETHLPGEWLNTLVAFIAAAIPHWRDDLKRPTKTSETALTAQLCARLNGLTRLGRWDFIQFKREEPDETCAGRTIDLAVAPSGTIIWIEGKEYSEYRILLPIECKRLPTPTGAARDEREYLFSRFSSTGGVQRFKAGHHGAAHTRAVMIAYVQDRDILFWRDQLSVWIDGIVGDAVPGWSDADKFSLVAHDPVERIASLQSNHIRHCGPFPILIDHLWIEM